MEKINTLHDLIELGIKLKKNQELPSGFICTVWCDKEVRATIFKELLDNNIDTEHWKIENKSFDCYQFKILGLNFLIF